MTLFDVLFALLMAVVFTLIFAVGLRRTGALSGILVFFLVIFLAAWAGGLWIGSAGPVALGIYWLPIVLVAFLVALIMSTVSPRRPGHVETISEAQAEEQQQRQVERAFNAFFWTLLIGFIVLIVLGYVVQASQT